MMTLDDEEAEIALVALRHTLWRANDQTTRMVPGCTEAAWWCTKHCIAKFDLLIARIEEALKDHAEEKADGR